MSDTKLFDKYPKRPGFYKKEKPVSLEPAEGEHSLHYGNRPEFYPKQEEEIEEQVDEEIEEEAAVEDELKDEITLDAEETPPGSEEEEEPEKKEAEELDPAIINFIAHKVKALKGEELVDAAEVYISAEGIKNKEGIDREVVRVKEAMK